jgi:uncharacterized protein YegL
MAFSQSKKPASGQKPQIVTLIVDDSGSMQGTKAKQATAAMQDMVIQMQAYDQGSATFRFLLNIAKFGTETHPIAEALTPKEVNLSQLDFTGSSDSTNMPAALEWGAKALKRALERCRAQSYYVEAEAPNPLCVFFSDGENMVGDVEAAAMALKSLPFKGGGVDVIACAIEMQAKDFSTMQKIASRPELAINIDQDRLSEFIAEVEASVYKGEDPTRVTAKFQ